MSLPDPILNACVEPELKQALTQYAERHRTFSGTLVRDWIRERLLAEEARDEIQSLGLNLSASTIAYALGINDCLRRLSPPALTAKADHSSSL